MTGPCRGCGTSSRPRWRLAAGQVDALGFGEDPELLRIRGGLGVERAVHHEPVPGQSFGRPQQTAHAPGAEAFTGGLPQRRRPRDTDRQPGTHHIV